MELTNRETLLFGLEFRQCHTFRFMLTPQHAKLYAHELTLRRPSGSMDGIASSLSDIKANVQLNPHQIDAALFAFNSPLSRGAILADEVGLGKTIEAGIVLSQKWAERKRRLLIIMPANLRKQWSQELSEKFFLPSIILEKKSWEAQVNAGNFNPFEQDNAVVICSYQFARGKEIFLKKTEWDLVVIDEAHRLRNVYKPNAKISNTLKNALADRRKILLTATPLQNSLMELYGLVSIIDEHLFGDLNSFKAQYGAKGLEAPGSFDELKKRLSPVCQRTLRSQVLEYVSYTNRCAVTQKFEPTNAEQRLYDLVSEYLQDDNLYALPSGQRPLMTLILRRLLASSTYAISGTLDGLARRLQEAVDEIKREESAPVADAPPADLAENFETVDEIIEEWVDDDEGESGEDGATKKSKLTKEDLPALEKEIERLKEFAELAKSISKNSKGECLSAALAKGFAKTRELNAPEKAIIFTESTRTQLYLKGVLDAAGFAGKIVLFNGTNNDPESNAIYNAWLKKHAGTDRISGSKTADKRAALVEHFRDEAVIMIATEAAAEGINLQFCSLVINYDLPWNPQRIEQRIGRCHRYGQKFDVVVVNFLNTKNHADVRVYELLSEKFNLFSGVFGASDEVIGAIENGIDFEKRIAEIYQKCRTSGEIQLQFNFLQTEMESKIENRMEESRKKLLENFDAAVSEKLLVQGAESKKSLSKFEENFWALTKWYLRDCAEFDEAQKRFTLHRVPAEYLGGDEIPTGNYSFGKSEDGTHLYRTGHPLAGHILDMCQKRELPVTSLVFRRAAGAPAVAALEPLAGKSGWLRVSRIGIETFEKVETLVFAGVADDGTELDQEQCRRLFNFRATEDDSYFSYSVPAEKLEALKNSRKNFLLKDTSARDMKAFEEQMDKLDRWSEDKKTGLKSELRDLEEESKEKKKSARLAATLPERLKLERECKEVEKRRDAAWKKHDEECAAIDKEKERLLDTIEKSLSEKIEEIALFDVRWTLPR